MALSEVIARLGFRLDDAALKRAQSGMNGFIGKLQQYGSIIAGSLVVRGAVRFIDDLTSQADAVAKAGHQFGMSGSQIQQWQFVAGRAGVEAEKLNVGLKTLSKQAYDASRNSKTSVEAFDRLGISWKNGNGDLKDMNTLMYDTVLALGSMKNKTEQNALAQQLLGRAGGKLLPSLDGTKEGLDGMIKRFEELGGGFVNELLPMAEDARDRFQDFEVATNSLKSRLAVAFLPTLNRVIGTISSWMGWVSRATKGTNAWKSALATLAAVSLSPLIKMMWQLGRAALIPLAKIALLYLVIDDLMTFFQGGDSLIGRGLDALFGKGASNTVRKELGGLLSDLQKGDWDSALERIGKGFEALFSAIGVELVKFVADDVPAAWDLLMTQTATALKEWAAGISREILAAIPGIVADAQKLANDFVDGIVEGLKAGLKKVTDAAVNLVGPLGALGAIRDKLDSKSPSKAAQRLFATVPQGAVLALQQGKPDVVRAMNAMVPAPLQRSYKLTQTNHNQITVNGGPANRDTGRAVASHVSRFNRMNLDDAATALVPLG